MAALVPQTLPWIAVAAMLLSAGAALALLTARSLFGVCIALAALSACAAAALLALGYADGALALAAFGAGIAPVLLLAGVLLSSRAVKPRARGLPWLSIAAAACAAAAMLWAAPTLGLAEPVAAPRGGVSLALAMLIFVAIAACVALLGYGERGMLGRRDV
jgi:uncharacterized MnhB-related membrane protein